MPELETLLALCKAAPKVGDVATAEQLLNQLAPYLPESFAQAIAPSPFLRDLDPSPWEILTHNLTFAILSLAKSHESLKGVAVAAVKKFVLEWTTSAASLSGEQMTGEDLADNSVEGDVGRVLCLAMSMLGFLCAVSECASIWQPAEMLELIGTLRNALSEKLMIVVEASVSNVLYGNNSKRSLREWRRHTRHYAAMGRPLGALLLHHGLMQVVLACTATIASPIETESSGPVLDRLQAAKPPLRKPLDMGADALLVSVAAIAEEELDRINADSEYVKRVGTVWQQHIAHAIMADALTTYLCCAVLNEEIADSEKLLDWLESTLADDILAADEVLASVVLKSMSVLGRSFPDTASHLSRSLPRVIVQGGLKEGTSAVAADCLASVLMLLPQDAVITTLYSLGNVLSGKQGAERTGLPQLNGSAKANGLQTQHQTGSTISLSPADVDEPSHVYATVIQTIVGVACRCKDQKISELALSMLVQKIGRVSVSVDAKIIIESSLLGAHSGPGELRALLKLYSKIARDAIVQDNVILLDAVSLSNNFLDSGS